MVSLHFFSSGLLPSRFDDENALTPVAPIEWQQTEATLERRAMMLSSFVCLFSIG
ncbi:hypothetical protein FORC36_4327 [Vibrio vulnificus]|nr:hypothetical protein FORC17_4370 [Vibrio vulnificus]ARN68844.1 hypothetical protein FORC36_4327 [Vibrio vulnificus]